MEQYIGVITAFLTGGVVQVIVTAFLRRTKDRSDLNIDRDGEIMKWLDKALKAADELIAVKYSLHELTLQLDDCKARMENCDCHEAAGDA